MPINYFSSENGSIAVRLDAAWEDLKNKSLSTKDRLKALDFMIYVFDIKEFHKKLNLTQLLFELMAKRESKKNENPNYIPVLTTGKDHFGKTAALNPTVETKVSSDQEIQTAFNDHNLLDVNTYDKKLDLKPMPYGVTYLEASQKAEFNLQIQNGLFQKDGKIYDSSNYVAHHKPGYVAFTFNANGELDVFSHLSGGLDDKGRRLLHSSMNAGAPTLCAGEMEIKNGKLISINTYSGHYGPSLYDVARFLGYLSDRGIDISEAKVYLQKKPSPSSDLQSKKVRIADRIWNEVPAPDIVRSVKTIMKNNINSLDAYLKSNKTQLLRHVNKLTNAKAEIAYNFQNDLLIIMDAMQSSSSLVDIRMQLEFLDTILTRHQAKLTSLKGKTGRLDSKFSDMAREIKKELDKYKTLDKNKDQNRVESFKKAF